MTKEMQTRMEVRMEIAIRSSFRLSDFRGLITPNSFSLSQVFESNSKDRRPVGRAAESVAAYGTGHRFKDACLSHKFNCPL